MSLSTKPGRLVSPKFTGSEFGTPAAENGAGAGACGASIGATPVAASWRNAMKDAVRDPAAIFSMLDLPAELLPAAERAAQTFGLFVPRGF